MNRRVDQTLHAVNRNRTLLPFDIKDALDAEDPVAMAIEQHGQPHAEAGPVDPLLDHHGKGAHGGMGVAIIPLFLMMVMMNGCCEFFGERKRLAQPFLAAFG